ncbi:hypothetical protein ADUPG1_013250, partial [Aduncisulcus paluster]
EQKQAEKSKAKSSKRRTSEKGGEEVEVDEDGFRIDKETADVGMFVKKHASAQELAKINALSFPLPREHLATTKLKEKRRKAEERYQKKQERRKLKVMKEAMETGLSREEAEEAAGLKGMYDVEMVTQDVGENEDPHAFSSKSKSKASSGGLFDDYGVTKKKKGDVEDEDEEEQERFIDVGDGDAVGMYFKGFGDVFGDEEEEEDEAAKKKRKRREELKEVNYDDDDDMFDESSDESSSVGDSMSEEAEQRAIDLAISGEKRLTRTQREALLDAMYNRRMIDEDEDERAALPDWFREEEEANNVYSAPITKEEVEEKRRILRESDDRPMKKALEYRARQRMKMFKRVQAVNSRAEALSQRADMSETEKMGELQRLAARLKRRAEKKVKKPKVVWGKAHRGGGGLKGKRKVKRMDKRMRADGKGHAMTGGHGKKYLRKHGGIGSVVKAFRKENKGKRKRK